MVPRHRRRQQAAALVALLAWASPSTAPRAGPIDDFYRGKKLSFLIGEAVGGESNVVLGERPRRRLRRHDIAKL